MTFRETISGAGEAFEQASARHHDTIPDGQFLDKINPKSEKESGESKLIINQLLSEALKSLGIFVADRNRLDQLFKDFGGDKKMRGLIGFIKNYADGGKNITKIPTKDARKSPEKDMGGLGEHARWQARLVFALGLLDSDRNSVIENLKTVHSPLSHLTPKKTDTGAGLKRALFLEQLKTLRANILEQDKDFFVRLKHEIGI